MAHDARQISLTVDERTLEAIEELKTEMNLSTTAAVIRRALALARIATRAADEDQALTIVNAKGEKSRILLAG
jgi:hypothetical protein